MAICKMTSEFKRDLAYKLLDEATEKGWTVRVEKVRTKRSLNQNALYWTLLTMFGIECGYTPDEMHADMKRAYGLYYKKNGKTYAKSTTTLDTKEMTDYIEYIRNEMAKNGIEKRKTDPDYMRQNWQELQEWFDQHKQHIGETK